MSSPGPPGPSGGAGARKPKVKKKVTKKKKDDEEKVKKDGSATDETASNSDRRDEAAAPMEKKPQSAGASMRDAAQRILTLALKAEWTATEGVIKSLEKAVEKAKINADEEIHLAPLAGIMDPVSLLFLFVHMNLGKAWLSLKKEKINYCKRCNRVKLKLFFALFLGIIKLENAICIDICEPLILSLLFSIKTLSSVVENFLERSNHTTRPSFFIVFSNQNMTFKGIARVKLFHPPRTKFLTLSIVLHSSILSS